jgi:hypothetical protein
MRGDRAVGWRDLRLLRSGCSVSASGDFAVRRIPGLYQPGYVTRPCRSGLAHLVALPGQFAFETSSACGPVKAPAAVTLPRSWYSSQAVA